MPNDSTCRRYHAVAAANHQRALAQYKYEIIFYKYFLIYANIVNITNILRYENLALYSKFERVQIYVCNITAMVITTMAKQLTLLNPLTRISQFFGVAFLCTQNA